MRIVVWTPERTDEVRALLRARAARRRRLVPTPNGTLLLGPAPEDLRGLLDTLRVATTGARSAVGFAWTDTTAWLVVRTERGVTGIRFGPERVAGPEFADGEFRLPNSTAAQIASALGVAVDEVHDVVATTSGNGLPRLRLLLDSLGFAAEARVLDWVDRTGPAIVPAYARRWPDVVFGELRQPRTARGGSGCDEQSTAVMVLGAVAVAIVAAAGLPAAVFAYLVFPWPWNVVCFALLGVLAIFAALVGLPNAVLMIVRGQRHDPFPISDPLGVLVVREQ